MSKITNIPYENEPETVKEKVQDYWAKRSANFSELRHKEAHSSKSELWKQEILSKLPAKKGLRILDVGCGSGFFELLLAPEGYQITGIDLTPEMIEKGNDLLARHNAGQAALLVMDAEHPEFPDESFDAVISRNLTWTLPHPADAYREWFRVLRPGGVLLNYDAEYAKGFHQLDQQENLAHRGVDDTLKEDCHQIYHMLSISAFSRPDWDIETLKHIGFHEVKSDLSVGDRIYGEKDQFYMPDRMFGIMAVK